jgi:carbohydrate kinase (thermoresistant glucokinase family)
MAPSRVVVIGVAGSGKSTFAAELATRRGVRFIEADELHSAASREKMASGSPLTDDDRWPWLAAVRQAMRGEQQAVVACSALKRAYRDALRSAGDVGFVYLAVERDEIFRRVAARSGHFMGTTMVDSQLAALEAPGHDEIDVVSVDASGETASVVDRIEAALVTLPVGTATAPLRSIGGPARTISSDELREFVDEIATTEVVAGGVRRVLLVPPDLTRLHSRAGEITGLLFERLCASGCEVAVLPALGTHAAMTPHEANLLFGDRIPFARILEHRWREGLVRLGEISADEVSALSAGRMAVPIPVEVDELLLDGWDLVVSIGQVVPHEVIGMANFTKNLVIGLGGALTIHRSHFLGAVCDMEAIMGRAHGPVRDVVDAAFDRFLSPRIPVLWVLTVTQDAPEGVVHRGVFVGRGRSGESGGSAYEAAADLSARCNIEVVSKPLGRVTCWLDPDEFTTTWVANKAVYRTRMALADGGDLVVLAPGVSRFGEDPTIDALIRRHGYRGTPAALAAVKRDPELAENLGAVAHLIHGSSEGRFRIVYCTDPATGGLTREEVEGVGYAWRSLPAELDHLGVTSGTATGPRDDRDGAPFTHISNPALGLWTTRARSG